jgi:hypothetical protein
MSIFNPWVILGFVLAMGTAFSSGYYKGENDESQRQQIEIAELNAKARETEQAMAKVAQTYGDTLRKANRLQRLKKISCVLLSTLVLSSCGFLSKRPCSSVPVSETPTAAGGSDSGEEKSRI